MGTRVVFKIRRILQYWWRYHIERGIRNDYPRWVRYTALFLIGAWVQLWLPAMMPQMGLAEPAPQTPCDNITNPLTPEEEAQARLAWAYFARNYQPKTGFTNSAGGYPSGSLWDIGNYLMALNSARWLNLIEQKEFDEKLNKFLTSVGKLELFENSLPNKVYHAATGQMVDYGNNPVEKGIGWSALDIGRILAALHVVRVCHPQYNDWIKGTLARWQIARSIKDGMLYGATVLPDKKTLLVQEGRLGYEEYAARGYELWDFKAPRAASWQPSKEVEIYGIKIPVDERDYQSTNANNYVVSESFILDGIEFGLDEKLADYAKKVLKIQELRYKKTGQLTAVTEDNIDKSPYFLYNTIYSNGVAWATINEKNEPYDNLRTISTKAAFGWRYLYPENPYTHKVFEAVKELKSPNGDGFMAGQYEVTKQPNKSLTGNTNGLILEILYYKAIGNQPLVKQKLGQKRPAAKKIPKKPAIAPPPKPKPEVAPPRLNAEAAPPPPPPNTPPKPVFVPTLRRQPTAAQPDSANACTRIIAPLTAEEQIYAEDAWQYFVKNYQQKTGFMNSAGGYPSGSLWDMGNYLMALNSARSLNLIEQKEFDEKLNKFLTTFGKVQLFEDSLPNKVYHAGNGQMVDYGNNPVEKGIGWSALDLGRMLAAFHVIRSCQPQYTPWLKGIVDRWQVARSIQDGMLYGATVLPDKKTLLVQEGRLGYEEYAARGYELWGFKAPKAASLQPLKFVDIYGVKIPVDVRDYQTTNANNYVVSESYILDGIEFGLKGEIADYAARLLQVQERRYRSTGQLTAVTEDNIDEAPYFIYNTVYSNGVAWAAINEKNEPYDNLRTISTKAAFGWRYLFPTNTYAKQVFDVVKDLRSPKNDGFFAGQYEKTKQPNKSLTANTNGLILEILHFKALGNQPLVNKYIAPIGNNLPVIIATPIAPIESPVNNSPRENSPYREPTPSSCPALAKPLGVIDKRYAQAAWSYFSANTETSGLANDRTNIKGATLWGLGNYLMALHSARTLGVIDNKDFDVRVRNLLGTVAQLPLAMNELPHRGYNTWSLQPVDYGNNPTPDGTGWSGLDIGRMMTALHTIKNCYPGYTEAIDKIALDWSYLRIANNGLLNKANMIRDTRGRMVPRIEPETRLGYEEYAARAFQLWGFDMHQAAVGGTYTTVDVEGEAIPTQRNRPEIKEKALPYTVSTPFLLYGLEYGFDPKMRSLVTPMLKAEANRYQRTNLLTASATMLIEDAPYVVHSTLVGKGEAWATLSDTGQSLPDSRIVSTATAFGWSALFPSNAYAKELRETVLDIYSRFTGFYEGFYEKTGKPTLSSSGTTNALILESLLYKVTGQQPLVRPQTTLDSAWWQAVRVGDSGKGLPRIAQPTVKFIADQAGSYWTAANDIATAPIAPLTIPSTQVATPTPVATSIVQAITPAPIATPIVQAVTPTPVATPIIQAVVPTPVATPITQPSPPLTKSSDSPFISAEDRQIAHTAWQYFVRNRNAQTGLVSAVSDYPWTTLWDQGSVLMAIHSARQLGILSPEQFKSWMGTILDTLAKVPLPSTKLPNKAYSTQTAEMRKLNNSPDPQGQSGTSALDTARLMTALHIIKKHHPEYRDLVQKIVARWETKSLVKEEWLAGVIFSKGKPHPTQEGRLGYEQYAAQGLKLWGIEAFNALHKTPIRRVKIEGVSLEVDQRDQKNSGAGNYLTNEPYLLWGLEMGWPEHVKPQVQALLDVQEKRFKRTGILTAVNEDSINRPPYFLYYSVYANGQEWTAITPSGKAYPDLHFISTKAAFGWSALLPDNNYANKLRSAIQDLAVPERGFYAGRYEKSKLGNNTVMDANTNAVILESLLYAAKGNTPLID